MKLKSLSIRNLKSIQSLDLEFDGKSAVIFGINGTGKSTLLSAMNAIFRTWLTKLTGKKNTPPGDNDITIGQDSMSISAVVELCSHDMKLECFAARTKLNDRAKTGTYNTKQYQQFVDLFKTTYLANPTADMPIFVSYGTNRAVLNVPNMLKEERTDKLTALEDAIDQSVDFKKFFAWYRDTESKSTIDMRDAIIEGTTYTENKMLMSVQKAITGMLDDVTEIRIKRDPVRMTVNKNGQEIRVDMLSDGEKCTLALLGDLARRLCIANPLASNPLDGAGIVLIDEVELHMHPSWQRKILSVLTSTFPNVQFIVTTHSPQVLGETNDKFLVCTATENGTFEKVGRLDGADSNLILEKYMQTPSISSTTQEIIDALNRDVVSRQFVAARKKLAELYSRTGENSEQYILSKGFLERSERLYAEN